jgi:D-alanyl-D-alanine carboxypeptidase
MSLLPVSFSRRFLVVFSILSILVISWSIAPAIAAERGSRDRHAQKKFTKKKADRKKVVDRKKVDLKKSAKIRGQKSLNTKKIKEPPKGIQAKAFFCENVASKCTLLARDPDKQLPVASLTKLVTALVALDRLPLNQKLKVPDHIKKVPKSVVGLQPGDEITVEDLLHGLLIRSGNDCAETLACSFTGGREKFLEAMNEKARSIGTRSTVFYTPSGLDRKVDQTKEGEKPIDVDSNLSTAREIAQIARAAFSNSRIREICRKQTHVIASGTGSAGYALKNTNKLLRDNLPLIGGKTGYTSRAGHCLATAFTPGRNVFMIVVLGSPDHFRDTRLVYRKALKESHRIQISPTSPRRPQQIASENDSKS